MTNPDDEKADPRTMPDKPGNEPQGDIEDKHDRRPRGPSTDNGDESAQSK